MTDKLREEYEAAKVEWLKLNLEHFRKAFPPYGIKEAQRAGSAADKTERRLDAAVRALIVEAVKLTETFIEFDSIDDPYKQRAVNLSARDREAIAAELLPEE